MDLLDLVKTYGSFGIAGLILLAWMVDSKRKDKMISDLTNKLFSLGQTTAEVTTKLTVLIQERLPGGK